MKLDDYKCPNWNNINNLASFSYKNIHPGINEKGQKVFYLLDKYPHNVIFKL